MIEWETFGRTMKALIVLCLASALILAALGSYIIWATKFAWETIPI